jgi:hypothetical protein
MLSRLSIGLALAAVPALAGAQTATTVNTAPHVTQLVTAPPNINRPHHPHHPNGNSIYGNGLSPVIMMNGYAIMATPSPQPAHRAHSHHTEGIQQDQFGTWSTSGH